MRFKIDKKLLSERIRAKKPTYDRLKAIVHKIFDEMRRAEDSEPLSRCSEDPEPALLPPRPR